MCVIGLAFAKTLVEHFFDKSPGLGRVGLEKTDISQGRVILVPEAVFTSKRRDTAFHGNPGAGEHRGMPGILD